MPEESGLANRSNDPATRAVDPYCVGTQHVEETTARPDSLPSLREQISRDLGRAACGFLLAITLFFVSALLGSLGTAGSYWGNWRLNWQSYLPLHLAGICLVFTIWSGIRALIAALISAWRI
jgi:hypothetical protein